MRSSSAVEGKIGRRQWLERFGIGLSALNGFTACSAPRRTGSRDARWRLGLSSPHEIEILNEFYADMKREARRIGNIDLIVVDAADDPVKQFTDIEAFIAQQFDGVFFLIANSEGMDEIVARGVKRGTYMFNHSASPVTGCSQNVVLDQFSAGYKVGESAARWINERHSGQAEVGLLVQRTDPQLHERSKGLKEGVLRNCPRAVVAGEVDAHSVDLGASGAANLLQAHPGIKAILAFSDDPGYGAYTAAKEAGRTDPNQFFIGSADGTQLVLDLLGERGIYQACASFLFSFSATQWMRDMVRCLRREKVPPTRIMSSRLITSDTLSEFQRIARNPLAAENQKYYSDSAVMRYSDEQLKTPIS